MKIKYAYFMVFSILVFMLCACAQTESEKTEQVETEQVETEQVAETEEIYEEVAYFSNAPQKLGLTEEEKYTYTQVSDEEVRAVIEKIKEVCIDERYYEGINYELEFACLSALLHLNRNCISERAVEEIKAELATIPEDYGYDEEYSYLYFCTDIYQEYILLPELIFDEKLKNHAAIMDYFATDDILTDEQQLWFYQNYAYFGNDTYTDYDIHDYEHMPELRLIDVFYVYEGWSYENNPEVNFYEIAVALNISTNYDSGEFLYEEFRNEE